MPFSLIHAYCIMETGNMGMLILGDHMLSARHLEFIIPGPQAHWAKLAFEKYFLYTRKHGHVGRSVSKRKERRSQISSGVLYVDIQGTVLLT
jgi:hypothetical protein